MSFRNRIFHFLKANAKKYLLSTSKYGWFGDYPSWEHATAQTTGYDSDLILNKVKTALLKVKNGEAVYERDSVNFDEIQYSWGALSGLLYAAQEQKDSLTILDFGGSLGSGYYQNRLALKFVPNLSWNIIEQSHFVKTGNDNFKNNQLSFYENIETYNNVHKYTDVLLLSSVIQYIEKPFELLDTLLQLNPNMIIIDITTFTHEGRDMITIQKVPPFIYDASYACWFFDQEKFMNYFSDRGYFKMGDWKMPYEINFGFHAGVIFTKTKV
jgi:putative methyltransferase (TIGR04325 family)